VLFNSVVSHSENLGAVGVGNPSTDAEVSSYFHRADGSCQRNVVSTDTSRTNHIHRDTQIASPPASENKVATADSGAIGTNNMTDEVCDHVEGPPNIIRRNKVCVSSCEVTLIINHICCFLMNLRNH
jgi:hypothetical protein